MLSRGKKMVCGRVWACAGVCGCARACAGVFWELGETPPQLSHFIDHMKVCFHVVKNSKITSLKVVEFRQSYRNRHYPYKAYNESNLIFLGREPGHKLWGKMAIFFSIFWKYQFLIAITLSSHLYNNVKIGNFPQKYNTSLRWEKLNIEVLWPIFCH